MCVLKSTARNTKFSYPILYSVGAAGESDVDGGADDEAQRPWADLSRPRGRRDRVCVRGSNRALYAALQLFRLGDRKESVRATSDR
jgi:hypothetical protein